MTELHRSMVRANLTEEKQRVQTGFTVEFHCNGLDIRRPHKTALFVRNLRITRVPFFAFWAGKANNQMIKNNLDPAMPWRYGQDGPGGGSVPYNVMATGALAPFAPLHARRDISENSIEALTKIPVGMRPGMTSNGPYPDTTPAPAPASAAMADAMFGAVLGADAAGRPMRHFRQRGMPSREAATSAITALKQLAQLMRDNNLASLAPPLVGGPLAALARGEAIVLRWPNGVALTAAL